MSDNSTEQFGGFNFGAGSNPNVRFVEEIYLSENPEVKKLLEDGSYKSALEYYAEVGQFKGTEGAFAGTNGSNDVVTGFGKVFAMTGVDFEPAPEIEGIFFRPTGLGVGETDTLIGEKGSENIFFLGAYNPETPEPDKFYVGEGDKDYALIQNYTPGEDKLGLAGKSEDYKLEVVNGNTNISTTEGDLVAVIDGVTDLQVLKGEEFPESEFFELGSSPLTDKAGFYEEANLVNNPNIKQLLDDGVYKSVFDWYVQEGQYAKTPPTEEQPRGELVEGLFFGTENSDVLTGFGQQKYNLTGVAYEVGEGDFIPLRPKSLGVGEKDTLIGTEGVANDILLGSFINSANPTAEKFYVGKGNEDYALIKNFTPGEDLLKLAGKPEEYKYEAVDGNLNISTNNGDLVAIVEGVEQLDVVGGIEEGGIFFLSKYPTGTDTKSPLQVGNFNEDLYLLDNPNVKQSIEEGAFGSNKEHYIKYGQYATNQKGEPITGYFDGTNGNDYILGFGQNTSLSGVGYEAGEGEDFSARPTSLGVGEADLLIGSPGAVNSFLLGSSIDSANPTAEKFYVGNGDKDYAQILNFDTEDQIVLAGKPEEYTFGTVDGNFNISTSNGDLIASVQGMTGLQVTQLAEDRGVFLMGTESTSLM